MTENNSILHLSFSSEDYLLNETLLVWNILGKKPHKKGFNGTFSQKKVEEVISGYSYSVVSQEKFFDTHEDENHVKILLRLDENLFIGYQYLEKLNSETILPLFTFYYIDVDESIIDKISKEILDNSSVSDTENEGDDKRVSYLSLSSVSGFTLEEISPPKVDWKNIWKFYNESVEPQSKKWNEFISKNKQTITVVTGKPGSGKTTLIRSLTENLDLDVVYIPSVCVDLSVTSPEFIGFCQKIPGSIVILDCVDHIVDLQNKNLKVFLSVLKNVTKGFFKDVLDVHFVLILDDINLLRILQKHLPIDFTYKLEDLEPKKASQLSKFLGIGNKFTTPTNLSDVIGSGIQTEKPMGF